MEDQIIQTKIKQATLTVNTKIWNEKTEKLLTPDFLKLLTNLHDCLNEERKAILDYRFQSNKALQKEFEKVISEQQTEVNDFYCNTMPDAIKNCNTLISCAANQTRELIKLINGNERYLKPDAVTVDFADTLKPSWINIVDGVNNLMEIADENAKFSQRSFVEFSLTGEQPKNIQPQIIIKPRQLHCLESNITMGDENFSAAMLDVALTSYYAVRSFLSKEKTPVFAITCANQYDAQWWNELFAVMEEYLKLTEGSIKVIATIDSTPGMIASEAIVSELSNRIVGLQADFKGKLFSDLKLLRKKSDNIVAERKALNSSEVSIQHFAKQICNLSRKYNLKPIAGLSINAAGQFVDYKDVDIAKYEEELTSLINLGFSMLTVSHQGYIENVLEVLKKENEILNQEHTTIGVVNLMPQHSQKISMLGLRDNIRAAITFMHAWNQGIAYAVFDNRWEDLQTFEIIRAQVYQWIRNSVHIATTGERINSRMITTIILEESEKLQDEIREEFAGNPVSEIQTILNTYTKAALEVEQLFLNDELAEYFGNVS